MRRTLCLLTLALLAVSCAHKRPTAPVAADVMPNPDSPASVVRAFAWVWQHRAADRYDELLTADFRFVFAPSDSSGNPYPNGAWALADELISAGHLFVVGPVQPPASQIALSIADVLVATPDPRAGRDPKWHKIIRTPVDLQMTTDSGGSPAVSWVSGYALFYLVRGDSASIPPRLVALGWTPDSTRWWIQRWEDETAGASGSPADVKPAQNLTWGAVKARYR